MLDRCLVQRLSHYFKAHPGTDASISSEDKSQPIIKSLLKVSNYKATDAKTVRESASDYWNSLSNHVKTVRGSGKINNMFAAINLLQDSQSKLLASSRRKMEMQKKTKIANFKGG